MEEMMVYDNWQKERAQLNHNWLQNGVLVGLNHALKVASGTVRPRVVRQALAEDILKWKERRLEVPKLLGQFEEGNSPKALFNRVPLCRCSHEVKRWLVPLTHDIWLWREKVREKIYKAKNAYDTVERTFRNAWSEIEKLPESPDAEGLKPFELRLQELKVSCEALSLAISFLPKDVS